jgi:hypothetical protein
MLANLLIGLSLWTATSVLAAIALGRILQRDRVNPGRQESEPAGNPLSDVA